MGAFQFHEKRIVIDAVDMPNINKDVLEWCDVYGKVNFSYAELPSRHVEKIVPIGPSFGVRIWPFFYAGVLALSNWPKSKLRKKYFRSYIANYFRQFRYRLPESQYFYTIPEKNYIFFLSTIWKGFPKTNNYRMTFIKYCKSMESIEFEGGFAPQINNKASGYDEYKISRRYGIAEYIEKTKRSMIVFNTPAVKDCLGWKLGEYLALGKAIISTPLVREMPAKLIHGKHVHFTDGSEESIYEAIKLILNDQEYRKTLEINAREYYLEYLKPERVIDKLINLVVA